jgi:8-oxo-dGTP diphosphatase
MLLGRTWHDDAMSGDGDGWVICAGGHRHWGRYGAAGLLISDGERAILQHRAPWTHEGGTWGLPGGARDSHEDAITTALREAQEEAAITADSIEPVAMWVDQHGGWSYTTVLARPLTELDPHAANAESTEIRWWTSAEIDTLPLHYGFAATWPRLRTTPAQLLIVVDVRAHPTFAGWRPSTGPAVGADAVMRLVRSGIPVAALPSRVDGGAVSILLPQIMLVAPGERIEREAHHQVIVVTTDDGMRQDLAADVAVVEPSWLLDLLRHHLAG